MDHFLDITADVCPMTFVRTRLLIERMAAGDTATIVLRGVEPIENVPASVTELGHRVIAMLPLAGDPARARLERERGTRDGDMVLRIAKT
ncbi:MAG: sulfurtransferase TusA family protein [Defluviicoccus sp.]|nr:sulfurtransferase TusA family protein [Defluviicoccus sp.]